MIQRRTLLATLAAAAGSSLLPSRMRASLPHASGPIILSTWDHGIPANAAAMDVLKAGGSALDAAERGVMVTEADVTNRSVGLTGYPDRDGIVTLDACIMDGDGRAGSVSFVQGIKHPVALARKVMEQTPHVMMVGKGAEQYARELGIEQLPNALPPDVQKAWDDWKRTAKYQPVINIENHDTIGLVLMDASGRMAGACTTSGLAWKMHGRVGDSPIIGAGLYVDNEVGAATCTGVGEYVLRTLASFLAVERMRMGDTPQQACEEAIRRIKAKHTDVSNVQVGILAIDKQGRHGAASIHDGFTYALYKDGANILFKA